MIKLYPIHLNLRRIITLRDGVTAQIKMDKDRLETVMTVFLHCKARYYQNVADCSLINTKAANLAPHKAP